MIRNIFLFFTLVVFISVSGCLLDGILSTDDLEGDYISATLGREFQLEIGETGFLESENIKIKFLGVTADSRCPSDAICVQLGEVEALVNIWKDGQNLGRSTLVGPAVNDDRATKVFDGYSLKLLKVDPYPISTQVIAPSDYIVTLIVVPNEGQGQEYIPAVLDREFRLGVGQTGFLELENIEIKFLKVTSDSRCPSDVTCIWAGEVEVLVNIWKDDQDLGNLTLVGQNNDLAAATFDGYSVRLVRVDPYPISTVTIKPSDYIITLIVTVAQ